MSQLVSFALPGGGEVLVEAAESPTGMARAGRVDYAVGRASTTFEEALGRVRRAAEVGLEQFRDMAQQPDKVEVEFQVRLTSEAGGIIAKVGGAAHLTVRLSWSAAAADDDDHPHTHA